MEEGHLMDSMYKNKPAREEMCTALTDALQDMIIQMD